MAGILLPFLTDWVFKGFETRATLLDGLNWCLLLGRGDVLFEA